MRRLRRGRQELALLTALADLGGVWDVVEVTAALTAFADAAAGAAARFVLAEAERAGQIALPDAKDPARHSGWIILGMGKLGAGELNYSSDIDLIVLFDPEVAKLPEGKEPSVLFVRLTKKLVQILNEHTEDGYVFRTDLRLRPDPGATNIAISTEAALQYYESLGQNWERAALIKARPIAGDIAAGEAFLQELVPYIWRKYLDYAAISDIHSIKRQIHDHRGHEEIAVAGHNIKLGRGGIREIEFFVQTQQLIAGGRNPELRQRGTLETLDTLAKGEWIDAATRDDLAASYVALRRIEHALQMIADEQTHTLPEDDEGLAVVAAMTGYDDVAAFSSALTATLGKVRDHYAELFEAAPSLTSTLGSSLVFTGDSDDPETLAHPVAARLRAPRTGHRDGARLAFRPLPGDALGDRTGAADGVRAGADRGAGDDEECRRRLRRVRPFPGAAAGGRAALFPAQLQPRPARAPGDDDGDRASPRRDRCAPAARARRADRTGFLRTGAGAKDPGGADRAVACPGRRLRRRAKPRPHLRPGTGFSDRRPGACRHDRGAGGRRRLCDAGRSGCPGAAHGSAARVRAGAWHGCRAAKSRCSPWASSAGGR